MFGTVNHRPFDVPLLEETSLQQEKQILFNMYLSTTDTAPGDMDFSWGFPEIWTSLKGSLYPFVKLSPGKYLAFSSIVHNIQNFFTWTQNLKQSGFT